MRKFKATATLSCREKNTYIQVIRDFLSVVSVADLKELAEHCENNNVLIGYFYVGCESDNNVCQELKKFLPGIRVVCDVEHYTYHENCQLIIREDLPLQRYSSCRGKETIQAIFSKKHSGKELENFFKIKNCFYIGLG